MIEWYYILGIVSYALFIIQCIGSVIGSDFDIDLDFDGDIDFDGGDIFSFKGILHFCLGFSTYLMAVDKFSLSAINGWTYVIAVLCGLFIMYILYLSYKFCMKFNHENTEVNIINQNGSIYLVLDKKINDMYAYIVTVNINGGTTEITALSNVIFEKGDSVTILNKDEQGNYII